MNIIHIILIFILLFILINNIFLNYIENFEDNKNNIIFLNHTELYDILKSNTPYYNTFYENDFKVRNVKSIDEYIVKMKDMIVNFNNSEKDLLKECTVIADSNIKKLNFNYFDGIKASKLVWKIGLTKGEHYEGGLPHTINDTIILNRNNLFDKDYLIKILTHEKVHIYQKAYPEDFMKFLKAKNFIVVKKIEESDNIRANPDIDMYIYKKNNIIYSMIYKDNPKHITDTVSDIQYYEHPCETMAIMLTE